MYDKHAGDPDKARRWWDAPKPEVHEVAWAEVSRLNDLQTYRREANLHHLRCYSNRLAASLSGRDYAEPGFGDRIRVNLIKSAIDTAAAQLSTARPRPMYQTDNGHFEQLERAKGLNKFVSGVMQAMSLDSRAIPVFIDGGVFGTGFIHAFAEDGKIACERVFPNEIIVDDVAARIEPPQQMYRVKEMSKAAACERWPKLKAELEMSGLLEHEGSGSGATTDRINVIEAWSLPQGKKPGRNVIFTSECTIKDQKWERKRFPIVPWRVCNMPLGFWGIGFAEELLPFQTEINFVAQKIQELVNLSTTQIWMQRGEGAQLDNEAMGKRFYKNKPPVALNVQPAHQQLFDWLWTLYQRGFEQIGVAYSAATSQLPQGLKSGEAIRRHTELGSKRFQHITQMWEQWYLEIGEVIIDVAEEIVDAGGELAVLSVDGKATTRVDFADVRMDRDSYVTRVFPTAYLPDTPQGKVEAALELAKVHPSMGEHLMGLLTGVPDLDRVASRINAPYELVDSQISSILSDGKAVVPQPYQDLRIAVQQGTLELQRAMKQGAPAVRVELLRRYVDKARQMHLAAQPPAQPQPQQPGPQPTAPQAQPNTAMQMAAPPQVM